jgi:DNA-binding CsgD family transcriptional regulator
VNAVAVPVPVLVREPIARPAFPSRDDRDAARPGPCAFDPSALLDVAAPGLLVLDDGARLLFANRAGLRSLAASDAGLAVEDGIVATVSATGRASWRAGLREAAAGRSLALRLDGPQGGACVSLGPAPGRQGVVCVLPAARDRVASTVHAYARAHGLTRAETEVLEALATGGSAKTIARGRGASESTVRTQVRSILAKTGHAGLRALTIDVLRSAPAPLPVRF